ncbi:hypothetical protein [Streptomyces sp. NPDC057582]|uniref:hypothetical protein n=1 Tax=Streptomyces sp. NPDC057582 TaxID=3346174 RepID=UPI0036A3C2FA
MQPAPEAATLSALSRQLDRYLGGAMSPARTQLTALLAVELDTAARSGELVELRTTDLGEDNAAVYVERRPQGGGAIEGEWVETSTLTRAALERWLDVRKDLVLRAHGTSRLWVSLWMNHDGVLDDQGNTVIRPPGMPLEENGLITSYTKGCAPYCRSSWNNCGARLMPNASAPTRRYPLAAGVGRLPSDPAARRGLLLESTKPLRTRPDTPDRRDWQGDVP